MNANEILWSFVSKLVNQVDSDTFWDAYGEQLIALIVGKLFPAE